jgi:hypothetical protein
MVRSMQVEMTNESRPKLPERSDAENKARKNPVDRASGLPDCTFEELGKRCNTETTVLSRILHLPLGGKGAFGADG